MMTHKPMLSWILASLLAVASAGAAWAQEPNMDEPGGDRLANAVPSGTVDIDATVPPSRRHAVTSAAVS